MVETALNMIIQGDFRLKKLESINLLGIASWKGNANYGITWIIWAYNGDVL